MGEVSDIMVFPSGHYGIRLGGGGTGLQSARFRELIKPW